MIVLLEFDSNIFYVINFKIHRKTEMIIILFFLLLISS